MITIGIEQEIVFKNSHNVYMDFSNTAYETFYKIIDPLPCYEDDNRFFHIKSLETKPKRWYVEGFELHDAQGNVTTTIPKGIEIRTTPHSDVGALVSEFSDSFNRLVTEAKKYNITPLLVSHHPFKTAFYLSNTVLESERVYRTETAFKIACNAMLAHGLQVNLSVSDDYDLDDIFEKIVYYIPFILPYSFSSPFYDNELFKGLCARNYHLAASRIFTVKRQINGVHYIEFKGFDACADAQLLRSILVLFKALAGDTTLKGRSKTQDVGMIQRSCLFGFDDAIIKKGALAILDAASAVLQENEYGEFTLLREMIETNRSRSTLIKERYHATHDILDSISDWYDYS
jgi:hypothetical protein